VTGAYGATATTLLCGESGAARLSTTLLAALLRNMHCRPFAEQVDQEDVRFTMPVARARRTRPKGWEVIAIAGKAIFFR
jgi:hypothetical protein